MFLHCICFCAHDMYANDVDVDRRRSKTRDIDDGSCGIDGRLLLLPFIFIEELSIFNYWKCIEIDIKAEFFHSDPTHTDSRCTPRGQI